MSLCLLLTAVVALLAAVAAMSLRNLVHCALMLAIAFSGVAALYLQLDAEFMGFTEILVYVGAVAILIVMAILLTRSGEAPQQSVLTAGWPAGVLVTVFVFALLAWAVLNSTALPPAGAEAPSVSVKQIGTELMGRYVLPLEIIGLVLTAAMIGAVIIASREGPPAPSRRLGATQTSVDEAIVAVPPVPVAPNPVLAHTPATKEGAA
jgi:NADH-quinone oxidoreductase subunit J